MKTTINTLRRGWQQQRSVQRLASRPSPACQRSRNSPGLSQRCSRHAKLAGQGHQYDRFDRACAVAVRDRNLSSRAG
jgi:hypothetical protein